MGQVWSENGIKEAQGRVRKRTERENEWPILQHYYTMYVTVNVNACARKEKKNIEQQLLDTNETQRNSQRTMHCSDFLICLDFSKEVSRIERT